MMRPTTAAHPSTVVGVAIWSVLMTLLVAACGDDAGERLSTPSPTVLAPSVDPVPAGPVPQMAGVYDLTGTITNSDPIWGVKDGTKQITVLTIQHAGGSRKFEGTFTAFRVVEPDGQTLPPGAGGYVRGSIELDGTIVVELFYDLQRDSYWYGKGELADGRITGTFGAGGHMSGPFTAQRR